jgi:hypothetical protein
MMPPKVGFFVRQLGRGYNRHMSRPIAIFGLPEEQFVNKVFSLRQKLLTEQKLEEAESSTLPHLTILVNTTLDDLVTNEFLIQKLSPLVSVLKRFTLNVTGFEKLDSSVIAKFDTSLTRKLVYQMSSVLPGFRAITTDYIKILRRIVPTSVDEALETVKAEFANEITINRICVAGGNLRREDVIWTGKLG